MTLDLATLHNNLVMAAGKGDLQILRQCLEAGCNVDHDNGAALMAAVTQNQVAAVEFLLRHSANPRIQNDSALLIAASQDNLPIVRCLLEGGVPGHAHNNIPLLIAARHNQIGMINYLVSFGGDVKKMLEDFPKECQTLPEQAQRELRKLFFHFHPDLPYPGDTGNTGGTAAGNASAESSEPETDTPPWAPPAPTPEFLAHSARMAEKFRRKKKAAPAP